MKFAVRGADAETPASDGSTRALAASDADEGAAEGGTETDADAAAVVDAIRAGGGETVADPAAADAVATVGEAALIDAALADLSAPLFPVAADLAHHSVPASAVESTVGSLVAGDCRRVDHPVLAAAANGDPVARAVTDLTLLTSEPARISEFAVDLDGEHLDRFRADGVAVAAPLGSVGYARAAGGPILGGGAGVCVVPISPFATSVDTWVVDGELRLTIERDCPVDVIGDGRTAATVERGDRVTVRRAGSVRLLRPTNDGDWKSSNER